MITQERVKELFNYNEESGDLLRIKKVKGGKSKIVAGCKGNHGYLMTMVDKVLYLNHRLIWLWVYGYMPENCIDHINRNRLDNSIGNLREVSDSCNMRNANSRSDNTSGVRGVCYDSKKKKWYARVTCPVSRNIFLGYTEDFVEAVALRLSGEQWLNWAGCDSSSPAYLYIKKYKELNDKTQNT